MDPNEFNGNAYLSNSFDPLPLLDQTPLGEPLEVAPKQTLSLRRVVESRIVPQKTSPTNEQQPQRLFPDIPPGKIINFPWND